MCSCTCTCACVCTCQSLHHTPRASTYVCTRESVSLQSSVPQSQPRRTPSVGVTKGSLPEPYGTFVGKPHRGRLRPLVSKEEPTSRSDRRFPEKIFVVFVCESRRKDEVRYVMFTIPLLIISSSTTSGRSRTFLSG